MILEKYHTGLITTDYHRFPLFPYQGKGWRISLRNMPKDFHPRMSEMIMNSKGRDQIYEGKEIRIEAPSFLTAQRAANLIHSAILLLDASGFFLGTEREVFPVKPNMDEETQRRLRHNILSKPNLPLACMVAAKASFRREYSYALAKLRLSYEMASANWIDLDPSHSPNIPKSSYPEHQVRFAYGIILAYAVIEEIGLEIRASQKNPSTIKGRWNPVVKQELEQRLRDAGVDLSETFLWSVRGAATKLEKARAPRKVSKAPWSHYHVRDVTVELVDAIAHVSWLRSKVSSHKMQTTFVKVLSQYDVANAQLLARRLLLEKIGFWRFHEN